MFKARFKIRLFQEQNITATNHTSGRQARSPRKQPHDPFDKEDDAQQGPSQNGEEHYDATQVFKLNTGSLPRIRVIFT